MPVGGAGVGVGGALGASAWGVATAGTAATVSGGEGGGRVAAGGLAFVTGATVGSVVVTGGVGREAGAVEVSGVFLETWGGMAATLKGGAGLGGATFATRGVVTALVRDRGGVCGRFGLGVGDGSWAGSWAGDGIGVSGDVSSRGGDNGLEAGVVAVAGGRGEVSGTATAAVTGGGNDGAGSIAAGG